MMTEKEINEELQRLHNREKELLSMKDKLYKTSKEKREYDTFMEIINTINAFYISDEKERQEIFEKKLMYIGQYSRGKWLDMEHIQDLLNKAEHMVGKHHNKHMILPEAKKLYLKIYPDIFEYGNDVIYDKIKLCKNDVI